MREKIIGRLSLKIKNIGRYEREMSLIRVDEERVVGKGIHFFSYEYEMREVRLVEEK